MKVTVIGPNLRDQSKGEMHVHASGCADIARNVNREPEYANGWEIEAETIEDVTHAVYDPDDFGYDAETETDDYTQSIHFFPCVTLPNK